MSFKDLMEKAKHNDISKPAVNNSSADFKEAKKALKILSGRKKHKDDYDEDSEDDRRNSKKKISKKEFHNKPEIKKSKKELLNEQMEKRKREKERNLKAYDGSKDRVAQERMKLLKSRGIHTPMTSKISQDVTEMVKRMENRNNNTKSNDDNNQNKSKSRDSLNKSSSLEFHDSKSKYSDRYDDYNRGSRKNSRNDESDDYDRGSRKHSRYDESDDYDSEYEYQRRRKLSNGKINIHKILLNH